MVEWLKQSTAVTLKLGPFVDDADAVTAMPGLTISQADVRLSKNGGDMAQKNEATTATHDEGGWYDVPVDTTDTGTLGRLLVSVQESGALPVWKEYMVVPGLVWDSFFGADALQVHAVEISAGLITAAAIATGAIDADALATDAVTEIQSGMLTLAASLPGTPTADTVGAALKNASVGIPQSAAGATGGLATFDNVSLGVVFGTVDDSTTPSASDFSGNTGLSDQDDFYNGRFLIFTNNELGARKITDYVGSTRTFSFSGSAGEADQAFPDDPTDADTFIIFGFHGE